ncbi:hypothetical protein TNIN_456141 [Trichonephila inaurata madagascariensis]|uniref:Uncharacterized protein n=1 Tax=Trichonephila inaurata madagascariensis TaxID=2747483 RepID=A0A8X6WZA3_9ARAC|nr:hypothetical protein TNIN_456141 [Trichonephila inaurata madagascariensis]
MRFICPKHRVKPVVLLFHFIEYQIHKISARVEVRRFHFMVMLQLVGIPSQSYSQYSPDNSVQHSCLPPISSLALHSPCATTADMDCTICSNVVTALEDRPFL